MKLTLCQGIAIFRDKIYVLLERINNLPKQNYPFSRIKLTILWEESSNFGDKILGEW